jgi:hypothetical protein
LCKLLRLGLINLEKLANSFRSLPDPPFSRPFLHSFSSTLVKTSWKYADRFETTSRTVLSVSRAKLHQSPLFVTQALLSAISFHLLRVILAIFLPIVRVRLAPLPRTLQAHLLVHRIGSDLLPMIIAAALALACGVTANLLLRMIRGRLKDLSTVPTTTILH